MRIYVAGAMGDTTEVRAVQAAVAAAGHELALDWTEDVSSVSVELARADLDAVMAADAVLVVASEHDGRGMFVELGAALARAHVGELEHVVVIGEIRHESVFYFHPLVQRVATVEDWLALLPPDEQLRHPGA